MAFDEQPDQLGEALTQCELLATELRLLMWQGHGHEGLYGDDGEMQCARCGVDFGVHDYKNSPLKDVRETYEKALMARVAQAFSDRDRLVAIDNLAASSIRQLKEDLDAAEKVISTVRGFKVHGEAKYGTHGAIMFKELEKYDKRK